MCLTAAFVVAASSAPSLAGDVPAGWIHGADGSFAQSESGVVCAATTDTFQFVRLDGAAGPNVLGTCVYSGGDVRVGEIRVRKFVDGVGETPLAIQNDRGLMGVTPMEGLPPGARPVGAQRMGPGPEIDGNPTMQSVLTSVHGGLFVDCIVQVKRDKAEMDYGFANFEKACMALGGH
jgi:hypothetical protein